MKPLAMIIVGGGVLLLITGTALGALVVSNMMDNSVESDENTDAPPEREPTPTSATNPTEECLTPTPTVGDGPGTTETTVGERTISSDTIESRFATAALQQEDTVQPVTLHTELSVVARQHSQASAGGNTYEYTVKDGCEFNTVHTTILNDNTNSQSALGIADALRDELSSSDIESIREDHDAVGVGVYLDNGEMHLTVATLNRPT